MENNNKIFLIEIEHPYDYSFMDFMNRKEIYVSGVKEIPWVLDEDEQLIGWEEGVMKQVECNFWKEVASPYFRRIKVHLFSDTVLTIPIPVVFSSLKDWELISCLAVLNYAESPLEYNYYQVGERYGKGEKTIVKYPERLVKSVFCFDENGEKLTMEDYAFNLIGSLSEEEIEAKVKKYLIEIEEHKLEEDMEEFYNNEPGNSYEKDSYFKNTYYNDSLDMDQQSPEFWDNL